MNIYLFPGYVSEMITVPQLPIQKYTLFDLEAYTTYIVRVRAANRNYKRLLWGEFSNITLTTLMKGKLLSCQFLVFWIHYYWVSLEYYSNFIALNFDINNILHRIYSNISKINFMSKKTRQLIYFCPYRLAMC